METSLRKALVPMLRITAQMAVIKNNSTSISDEHITNSTTNSSETPIARVLGRLVGIMSAPSPKEEPRLLICSSMSGNCSLIRSRPCFMG